MILIFSLSLLLFFINTLFIYKCMHNKIGSFAPFFRANYLFFKINYIKVIIVFNISLFLIYIFYTLVESTAIFTILFIGLILINYIFILLEVEVMLSYRYGKEIK